MNKEMLLTVVTPEKKLLTDEVIEEVFVPGYKGELNILEMHAPLVTTLSIGILRYRRKGSSNLEWITISWGYCEVDNNRIKILAEKADFPSEIDIQEAQEMIQETKAKLDSGTTGFGETDELQMRLRKANVRLQVAELLDVKKSLT
jgi:F-type H+-transporting ATPase subunit epsilon